MATAWRIEQADRTFDSKPATPRFADDALLTVYVAAPIASDEERRRAALWVADYFAASHGCTRTPRRRCTKPEHARDVAEAREWLEWFGLIPDASEPPAEVVAEPAPKPVQRVLDVEWMSRAACRDEDLMLFFPGEGERPPDRDDRERYAKRLCGWCPVRSECLDYALEQPERYGTWGGMTPDERASERRRRSRKQGSRTEVTKEQDPAAQARDLDLLRRSDRIVARGQTVKAAARAMGVPYTSLRVARERAQARLAEAS
ncbi:WhiB family transcriptional regulator [Streptosporangium sp. NPDC050855]|uniref:WhiB family transcriptional regulator n=1 Tax=Streptosporangium sp. NPDC050855 TaxID=3366194 RepID=UPI00379C48EA